MSQLAVAPRIDDTAGRGRRPRSAGGIVRRTALVNRLRAAWSHPVMTIVAPVGYGKSTLLEQWAARDERRFVWAAPGSGEDGPHAPLDGIAAALEALAGELAESPTVVVFDDVHLLAEGALAAVAPLARVTRAGSMIVLAGRTEPAIPRLSVPGLRARGELLELGVEDLAFTWREARMLVHALGAPLGEAEITAVFEETEGWPAAVELAASSFGYAGLQAQCLASLTDDQRALLRRTSILDQLDRDVCDAVLGHEPGERELQPIDDLGVFLVPLDHRRRQFRCHRLLHPALREELESEEPGLVPLLHHRAADWFEAHGDAERAMEHAYAAGDVSRFMGIFSANALKAHNHGHDAAVARWIGHVDGARTLDSFPDAAALAARLHAHRGHGDQTARCLDAADRGLADPRRADDEPAVRAHTALVHAATDAVSPAAMSNAVEAALRHLAADDPWRPYALLLGGVASMLLGDPEGADDSFGRAAHAAERLGSTETRALALTERALLADARSDHARTDAYLSQILAADGRLDGFASHALTLAASARTLLRHGRLVEARRSLASAQSLVPRLTEALPWLAVQTRLELATAWVMLRDPAAARLLLEEADRILGSRGTLGVLGDRHTALVAEIDAMPSPAPGRAVRLTAAELRLLPLLATHLSFREIGDLFFLSRHTIKTQAISTYRKLGASSRSEAVERAEQLGLIDASADSQPTLTPGG